MSRSVIITLSILLCISVGVAVGVFDSGAADVYLKATRPDFEKIPIGVLGFPSEPDVRWSGMRVVEVLKADLQRSQIFSVVDLRKLGIKVRNVDVSDKAFFRQFHGQDVSVLVWGGLGTKDDDLRLDAYVYDEGSDEVVVGKRYVGCHTVVVVRCSVLPLASIRVSVRPRLFRTVWVTLPFQSVTSSRKPLPS